MYGESWINAGHVERAPAVDVCGQPGICEDVNLPNGLLRDCLDRVVCH